MNYFKELKEHTLSVLDFYIGLMTGACICYALDSILYASFSFAVAVLIAPIIARGLVPLFDHSEKAVKTLKRLKIIYYNKAFSIDVDGKLITIEAKYFARKNYSEGCQILRAQIKGQ